MLKRTIFYDGLCQLCSREIELFQHRVRDGSLAYVDISLPDFDAARHGIDKVRVNKHMHVRDEETGSMIRTVHRSKLRRWCGRLGESPLGQSATSRNWSKARAESF